MRVSVAIGRLEDILMKLLSAREKKNAQKQKRKSPPKKSLRKKLPNRPIFQSTTREDKQCNISWTCYTASRTRCATSWMSLSPCWSYSITARATMSNGIDIRTELLTRGRLMFLSPKKTRAATVRAINKTLTSVTAQASKLIRKDITASAGAVKAAIKPERATKAKPEAKIEFKAKGIPLEEFKPQERNVTVTRATRSGRTKPYQVKGWSVKVQKKKPRTLVRQGFRLDGGKFLRQVAGPKRIPGRGVYSTAGIARMRLQQAFGPSPATQIQPHIDELMDYTRKRLDVLLAAEIRYEDLRRRGQAPTRRNPR